MAHGVVYDSELIRIEASQKGWLAVRALNALIEAIALFETGELDWEEYFSVKRRALLAMKAFEMWHGKVA